MDSEVRDEEVLDSEVRDEEVLLDDLFHARCRDVDAEHAVVLQNAMGAGKHFCRADDILHDRLERPSLAGQFIGHFEAALLSLEPRLARADASLNTHTHALGVELGSRVQEEFLQQLSCVAEGVLVEVLWILNHADRCFGETSLEACGPSLPLLAFRMLPGLIREDVLDLGWKTFTFIFICSRLNTEEYASKMMKFHH